MGWFWGAVEAFRFSEIAGNISRMPLSKSLSDAKPSVARHGALRSQNLRVVVRSVFGSSQPLSRAEVSEQTGLSRAAVSGLVDRLVAGRLIDELPAVSGGAAGRPKVGLMPASHTLIGLGMEVYPESIGVCLMDLRGDIVSMRVVPGDFAGRDPESVLAEVGELARAAIAEAEVDGMQVVSGRLAIPGLVDSQTGLLAVAPALGWQGIYPVPMLGLGDLRVTAVNDSKLAAWMEGYKAQHDSFLYLHASIGVGGAIISDRAVFEPLLGWNGEIGHVVVDPAGPLCGCGARGCLEQYVGRVALLRAMGLPDDAGVEAIRSAVASGNPQALAALDRAAVALGAALGDFINLVGISTIVVGGEIVPLLPLMQPTIDSVIRDRVLGSAYRTISVIPTVVTDNAALKGAARASIRDVIDHPINWV